MRPALAGFVLFVATYLVGGLLPTAEWHGLGGWMVFVPLFGATFLILAALVFFAGLSGLQRNQIIMRARLVAGTVVHLQQRGDKSR